MLRKRNIISIILFWVILIVLYEMISIVFSVNDSPSQMNVQGFFMEQKDSLDVLMIGSSEVYSDYSPAIGKTMDIRHMICQWEPLRQIYIKI